MKTNKVVKAKTKMEGRVGEIVPVNFVRTETALKQFPFHLLDKHDNRDELTITSGDDVVWRVMFRAKEGAPRDLAYRIERLIIDVLIDMALRGGEPPTVIRLGTLRELSKVLGLSEGGKGKKLIRNALLQLHGTVIDVDGTAHGRWQKFGSIWFFGDKVPDGTRADEIILSLSPEYQAIIAKSPRRPLNWDYINNLPGAAARLYEIIAPRVYAALKSSDENPVARMRYSELANSIGIIRYPDRRRMYTQMYKLHKLHLDSGYFAKVTDRAKDANDWMIEYTPGHRARREFEAAKGRGEITESAEVIGIVQAPLALPPTAPPTEQQILAQRLAGEGVSQVRAQVLVEQHEESARLWLDVVARHYVPKSIRDVSAYLTNAIAADQPPPAAYMKALEAERCRAEAPRTRRPALAVPVSAPVTDDPLTALTEVERAALEQEFIEGAGRMASFVKTLDRSGRSFSELLRHHLAKKQR